MEVGAHVWLKSPQSHWGWVPARIVDREDVVPPPPPAPPSSMSSGTSAAVGGRNFGNNNKNGKGRTTMVRLTLRDDVGRGPPSSRVPQRHDEHHRNDDADELHYFADVTPFETTLLVESSALANNNADGHPDIKLRNLPSANHDVVDGGGGGGILLPVPSPPSRSSVYEISNVIHATTPSVVGGVHDLIGLTHLHEPAILHALRLRYDSDIIYTSTGPILIAINPFQRMDHLYSDEVMEIYRLRGTGASSSSGGGAGIAAPNGGSSASGYGVTPMKNGNNDHARRRLGTTNDVDRASSSLPPHAYKTADEAYRAMRRGLEDAMLMMNSSSTKRGGGVGGRVGRIGGVGGGGEGGGGVAGPADQSILVSGESGAGKTVTTKIVLNYLAMLSRRVGEEETLASARKAGSRRELHGMTTGDENAKVAECGGDEDGVCIEQQVLQSNPILESFGNAKTLRNDNSSRFGKYIDIRFANNGKLSGATIETYLLEKVRLIRPSYGERNYHVFYQFLEAANMRQRKEYDVDGMDVSDFGLLAGTTDTRTRDDGVSDGEMHAEMLDAMVSLCLEVFFRSANCVWGCVCV
jgi:hypothetical protein